MRPNNFENKVAKMLSKPCYVCNGRMRHKTRRDFVTKEVESYLECNRCGTLRRCNEKIR